MHLIMIFMQSYLVTQKKIVQSDTLKKNAVFILHVDDETFI